MELIYLFTGIIVGSGVAYFFFSLKNRIKTGAIHQEFLEKEKNFVEGKVEAEKQSIIWEERFKSLKNETENWKSDLDRIKEENTNLLGRL